MSTDRRGGALLAVLWLSAALTAIAFAVAHTVRGEVERAATAADQTRAYFLARGAIERALLYILWGPQYRNPDGTPMYFAPGIPYLRLPFPTGEAVVELIPESSKIGANAAKPEELFVLLTALGAEPERARTIALGIVDWRGPAPGGGGLSPFDQYYLSLTPSFRGRHASMEEIEEVLLIQGMTKELFYGAAGRDERGRLIERPGFRECASVWSAGYQLDANWAQPAAMLAVGVPPHAVAAIVDARRMVPFRSAEQLAPFRELAGPAFARLTVGGGSIYTLRSTARLRLPNGQLSDLRKTVAAVVKFQPNTKDAAYHVIRWTESGISGAVL